MLILGHRRKNFGDVPIFYQTVEPISLFHDYTGESFQNEVKTMNQRPITDYMDELFAEALRQCPTTADAEDAVQETMLAALMHLERGGTIEHPRTWLHAVLTRKYHDILRRKYRLPTVTIDESTDFVDDSEQERAEQVRRCEQAEQIRRELSYLAESYRVIIAKHYFHGQSIRDIAAELGLPAGTVKSRMDFGRKQMRKGLKTMEHYTENSYLPKKMFMCNSGSCGLNMEPMSLVDDDDPLTQNLLLLAYEKPVTVSELSRAIGVAAAFIEPIIRRLVEGQLMVRMGDGKVYTDFIIYDADDSVRYIKEQEAFADAHADAYCDALEQAIDALKQTDFYSLRLERYMMLRIAGGALWRCMEGHRTPQIFPERPNGGRWIAFGMIDKKHRTPGLYTGRENYNLSGERRERLDSYLDGRDLALYNYESALYPYSKLAIDGFSTFMQAEAAALKLFYLIEKGIDPATVDADPRILRAIPQMEREGYLTIENGKPRLLIPHLTAAQYSAFRSIVEDAATRAAARLEAPMAEYTRTHRKTIPPHLKSVPEQKLTMPYEPSAMMFVFEAIRRGIHPRDLGYPCPETIAVFD